MNLLSYKDLSEATGISRQTLRNWVHRGKMPPPDVRPNGVTALWYDTVELRAWIVREDRNGLRAD